MPLIIDGTTYYTTREAAAELGIEWATVRDAIRRGALEKRPINPRLNMVPEPSLEEYRRAHLGQGSQARRLDPSKPVTKGALYARAYRARKKSETAADGTQAVPAGEPTPAARTTEEKGGVG